MRTRLLGLVGPAATMGSERFPTLGVLGRHAGLVAWRLFTLLRAVYSTLMAKIILGSAPRSAVIVLRLSQNYSTLSAIFYDIGPRSTYFL